MVLFELFFSFMMIGFSSFGGLSMVPVINAQMLEHGWMNAVEVLDIVAIAEMTPGPVGLNCATFAGLRTAGIPGAIAANLGVLMPTLTVTLAAAIFFEKVKGSRYLDNAMYGVRPVCLGMVAAVVVSLFYETYIPEWVIGWQSLLIGAVAMTLILKWNWSVPKIILLSAVLGLGLMSIPFDVEKRTKDTGTN